MPRQSKGKILVIDDDDKVLTVCKRNLESAGYEVITSNSALRMPQIVQRERPNLVLLDVEMPALSGQLVLVAASTTIPRVLGWREELMAIKPLTRRVFWTYAVYILGTNLFFGIVSTVGPQGLVDASYAARALTAFMCVYWIGRIVV